MQPTKNSKLLNVVVSRHRESKRGLKTDSLNKSLDSNVFRHHTPEQIKIIHFEADKSYQYVGVKELKAYY
jgi:hypothetical protein